MNSLSGIKGAIEETPRGDAQEPDARADESPRRRVRRAPLMPEAGAGGTPLTAVIAVISALASLALAAFVLIAIAADNWTEELASSVTVQVKGADDAEIVARTALVEAALADIEVVEDFNVVPSSEAAQLLEPWLGDADMSSYFNVPAMVELKIAPESRNAIPALKERIEALAPGVSLDDHGVWNDRLAVAARSGQAIAFGIFLMILAAACAISMFAARAGLAANHEIVALLHLVGATDGFIAAEVQKRFFFIGLRGSLIGLLLAVFMLGLAALATRSRGVESYLLPGLELAPQLAALLFAIPAAICLVTAVTARQTVLRALRIEY